MLSFSVTVSVYSSIERCFDFRRSISTRAGSVCEGRKRVRLQETCARAGNVCDDLTLKGM